MLKPGLSSYYEAPAKENQMLLLKMNNQTWTVKAWESSSFKIWATDLVSKPKLNKEMVGALESQASSRHADSAWHLSHKIAAVMSGRGKGYITPFCRLFNATFAGILENKLAFNSAKIMINWIQCLSS